MCKSLNVCKVLFWFLSNVHSLLYVKRPVDWAFNSSDHYSLLLLIIGSIYPVACLTGQVLYKQSPLLLLLLLKFLSFAAKNMSAAVLF